MTVGELIKQLEACRNPEFQVEIATSPDEDGWYEIHSVEIALNHREHLVVVINTD